MSIKYYTWFGRVLSLFIFLSFASSVSAHSTVSPSQTTVSKYETFVLSVPTEKEVPTTKVTLLVPGSLDRVTPFVKSGWKINLKKDSAGKVTEIEWSGGYIPAGQKDIFQFTGRTGTTTDTLVWKVYQKYQDGELVSWDRDPKVLKIGEEKVANPYSVTEVTLDNLSSKSESKSSDSTAFTFSLMAFVFSIIAFSKANQLSKN